MHMTLKPLLCDATVTTILKQSVCCLIIEVVAVAIAAIMKKTRNAVISVVSKATARAVDCM
jgi:hypothetical protein